MKTKCSKMFLSIASACLAMGAANTALSQATDSETSMITLTFSNFIIIENVDPVTIADPVPGTDAMGSDTFCVAASGFGSFSITFANVGSDPTFLLQSSNGTPAIPYNVGYANSTGGPAQPVMAGIPLGGQGIQASNCLNDNARFDIDIPATVWNGREPDGPFTGTLLITVEGQ
ncbi:hypothetical protein ACJJIU_04540 [Microbulbifer sp. CnH-101-E]|uniref:hypothetical protein n=1 Tax=unclassified Microbulbifer TaxID=2619833 RepID=UPI004039101D